MGGDMGSSPSRPLPGGVQAVGLVLCEPPSDFPVPIVVVQHLDPHHRRLLPEILARACAVRVKQAEEETEEQTVWLDAVNRRGRAIVVEVTGSLHRGPEGAVDGAILLMRPLGGDEGGG